METGSARGIRLMEQFGLSVMSSMAAGSPLLAVGNQRGKIQFSPNLYSLRADYLLQVQDNILVCNKYHPASRCSYRIARTKFFEGGEQRRDNGRQHSPVEIAVVWRWRGW